MKTPQKLSFQIIRSNKQKTTIGIPVFILWPFVILAFALIGFSIFILYVMKLKKISSLSLSTQGFLFYQILKNSQGLSIEIKNPSSTKIFSIQ